MRKIVDSNFLQDKRLHNFLSASPDNYAVLTDYLAMEAYKGDTLKSIPKSMKILAQYPKQVIILKSTLAICGLRGRVAGLQRRLIDERQTRGFGKYCQALAAVEQGDDRVENELLGLGHKATDHLESISKDVENIPDTIHKIMKTFTKGELEILRKGLPYTDELIRKFIKNVLSITDQLFENHPRVTKYPDVKELPNTFILRYALCVFILVLGWIEVGGPHGMKPERLRNDLVDVSMAAYATYFDGPLTADKNLIKIYEDAIAWLSLFDATIGK